MPAPLPSASSEENVPARPSSARTDPCPEKADSPAGGYSPSQNPVWTLSRRLGSVEPSEYAQGSGPGHTHGSVLAARHNSIPENLPPPRPRQCCDPSPSRKENRQTNRTHTLAASGSPAPGWN